MAPDIENMPARKGFRLFKRADHSLDAQQDVATEPLQRRRREWATATMLLVFALMGIGLGRAGVLWPSFDVFAHFRWQIVLFAIGLAIAIPVFKRKAATAGVALGVVFCVVYGLWPRIEGTPILPKPAGAVRLLHLNFYKNNSDPEATASALVPYDADIISIVEYTQSDRKPLAALLKAYPYVTECSLYCNAMLFSRFPIVDKRVASTPVEPNYALAEVRTPLGTANVFSTQFSRFPEGSLQFKHLRSLANIIGADPTAILMGDFNAVPGSRILSELTSMGLDLLTRKPSYPTFFGIPQLAIDHILVGQNWTSASDAQIGSAVGSDHYPVYLDIVPVKSSTQ